MPSRTKSKKAEPLDSSPVPDQPPEDIDPYEILSVPHDATDDQIKRAYRKAALRHHPDKATGADAATAHSTFQTIAFAYSILSEPARRARYDATGSTSASALDDADGEFDWEDFFKARFEEVTRNKLDAFAETYKGGKEERRDLLAAYTQAKGNMDRVYESVMLSSVLDDDERFRGIIDEAIEKGEVEAFKKYVNENEKSKERRRKRAEREAKEAEEELARREKEKEGKGAKGKAGKKSGGGEDELMAMIQKRQKDRGTGFLDQLEAKYAAIEEEEKANKKSKGSKKRKQAVEDDGHDEPPEEAFKAMGERMQRGKKAKH